MLPLLLMALTGVAPQPAAAEAPRPAPRAELRCQAACRERDAAAGAIMVTPVPDVAPAEPAASRVERSLARLNALRTASGTHPVARSELLSLSASRHAAYLSANGFRTAASVHAEAAGLDGFTGADPFARMRAAGYRSTYATEVVGDIGLQATDTDCVDHLMGTVYHATLLLSRVTEAGMAYGVGAAGGACVIDLGVPLLAPGPQAAATGQIVRYPWAGMTAPSGTLRLDLESPRPSRALLPDARVGMPVLVGLRNAAAAIAGSGALDIRVERFELRDARDMPVSCVILADPAISGPGIAADAAVHGGFAVLVPRKPLPPGRYRVLLRATIGAEAIAPAPWTFDVAPDASSGAAH
ncbi:MAG: CAP domain-containing protein [Burkholderiaceae bacterium]